MTDPEWGLEPRARFDPKFDTPPTLHEIQLSAAISQKRMDAGLVNDWWKPTQEDPFWMLEAEDGEWLKNEYSMLGTRDAVKAIRFPTEYAANSHQAKMKSGYKWWNAKATEHLWINSAALGASHDRS